MPTSGQSAAVHGVDPEAVGGKRLGAGEELSQGDESREFLVSGESQFPAAITRLNADVFLGQIDLLMQVWQVTLNGFPDDAKVHFVIAMCQQIAHVISK